METPIQCKALNGAVKPKNTVNVSRIVTMYYYDFTASYRSGREYHNFWELVYVDSGHVLAEADGETFKLGRGEVIFHRPNECHSVRCDGVTPANIFIITFVCKSTAMKPFEKRICRVPESCKALLSTIVAEMQAAYGENPGWITPNTATEYGAEQVIKNTLEIFLIEMLRAESSVGTAVQKSVISGGVNFSESVKAVIRYLEQNIYGEISLDTVCRITNYGKSRICETFKKETGKTVTEYYNCLKINEARLLMRERILSNTQISDRLGFSSPQYFIRVFRQVTGMTPGEYKKSVKYR